MGTDTRHLADGLAALRADRRPASRRENRFACRRDRKRWLGSSRSPRRGRTRGLKRPPSRTTEGRWQREGEHDDDVHALDMLLPKPEPSTSWIATSTFAFMCCTKPGPSSSRVRTSMLIASIRRDGSLDRHHLRPDHRPWTASTPDDYPAAATITNNFSLPAATICAPGGMSQFYGTSENDAVSSTSSSPSSRSASLDASLQILSVPRKCLAGDENAQITNRIYSNRTLVEPNGTDTATVWQRYAPMSGVSTRESIRLPT